MQIPFQATRLYNKTDAVYHDEQVLIIFLYRCHHGSYYGYF